MGLLGQATILEVISALVLLFTTFYIMFKPIEFKDSWKDAMLTVLGRDLLLSLDFTGRLENTFPSDEKIKGFLEKTTIANESIFSFVETKGTFKNNIIIAANCTQERIARFADWYALTPLNRRYINIFFIPTKLDNIPEYSDLLLICGYVNLEKYRENILKYLSKGKGIIEISDFGSTIDRVTREIFGINVGSSGDIPQRKEYTFLFVPNSGDYNSISEINITDPNNPREVSRHYTVPSGWSGNPSRTAIDSEGNAWIGNRNTNTLIKVGNLGLGTCVDKNGDGRINTARDRNNNGVIDDNEMVDFNNDECILREVILPIGQNNQRQSLSPGAGVRAVCVDANDNVYAGMAPCGTGYCGVLFHINKEGNILNTINLASSNCNPYGCTVDRNGFVWLSCHVWNDVDRKLVRYNPGDGQITVYNQGIRVYGITPTAAGDGVIFNAWTDQRVRKVLTNGTIVWSSTGPYQGRGITVDEDDNVYAVGTSGGNVWKYNKDGKIQKQISGVCGSPTGIGLDYYGNVWVACRDGQIVRLDKNLNVLNRITIGNDHYVYSDWTGYLRALITTSFNKPKSAKSEIYVPYKLFYGLPIVVNTTFTDPNSLQYIGNFTFRDYSVPFEIDFTNRRVYFQTDRIFAVSERQEFTLYDFNFTLSYILSPSTIAIAFRKDYSFLEFGGPNNVVLTDGDESRVLLYEGTGTSKNPVVVVNGTQVAWIADFDRYRNATHDQKLLLLSLILAVSSKTSFSPEFFGAHGVPYLNVINYDVYEVYKTILQISYPSK